MTLLRFWFTFEQRVDRKTYLRHGLLLAVTKYVIDAAIVWFVAGLIWTPIDYLATGVSLTRSRLAQAPEFLPILLAVWTLPFIWIGLTMSIRRALDAGVSAWLSLMFFLPILNYGFMLALAMLPSNPHVGVVERPRPHEAKLPSALQAIGIGAAAGLGMIAVSVLALRSYGVSLFMGTPFVVGALTAFLFNRRYPASSRETREVVFLSLAAIGGATVLFAVEGAVCVIMALPLAAGIGFLGASAGRAFALWDARVAHACIVVALTPLTAPLFDAHPVSALHEVRSAVTIAAPPAVVWRNVVQFPPLREPTELLFRAGIAYPIGARIEGTGVGAVRYCDFSTGPFTEPITTWETERRLVFDIVRQPPPMREWSPYEISPPHLDGYFRARRGEFRLTALPSGGTRLEGSTWYDLRIEPTAYWSLLATHVVGRIHSRVLQHIKALAESEGAPASTAEARR